MTRQEIEALLALAQAAVDANGPTFYETDHVEQTCARQIERVFDEHLHGWRD